MSERILISCPECGRNYRVPGERMGKKVTCKGCGHRWTADRRGGRQAREKSEVESLRAEIADLRKKVEAGSSELLSLEGVDSLMLRIGGLDEIEYVNSAFADAFSAQREQLIGQNRDVLIKLLPSELLLVISRPQEDGRGEVQRVSDSNKRTWEVKNSLKDGVQDVVLHDVSREQTLRDYVSKYVSADLTDLTAEDLATFKMPERRFMTVSFTDLRGFTAMSETLSP